MPTLAEIAQALSLPAPQGPAAQMNITGVATLTDATPADLSFLGSEKYLPQYAATKAAAVLVSKKVKPPAGAAASAATNPALLQVDDADLAIATILPLFAPPVPRPPVGAHPTATVSPTATIPDDTRIGPHVHVGDNTKLGRNCTLHPGVYLGSDVTLGDDVELFPNVVIRERCTLGNRVTIHANSTIGTDGFGYRWNGRQHERIPHIGTVVIEDDVEIGSNTCIDRAKFSATLVGRGTKIDNLVQVAHNCRIGPHCVIVGQTGLAGSVTVGAGVVLGGQSAVRDHVTLGDGAMLAACSAVMDDVDPKTTVSGLPALPHRQSLREQAALRRLPDLVVQVRKLQEELEALKKSR